MTAKSLSALMLDTLVTNAKSVARRRIHQNLHKTYDEPCQRLFNAIGADSYIRPHRHQLSRQDECLVAIRGVMALVIFDEAGEINETIPFGVQNNGIASRLGVGVEIHASTWHTVVALVPDSVLFEVKAGPFDPTQAKEFAPWAPEEGSDRAQNYLVRLKNAVEESMVSTHCIYGSHD